MITTPNLYQVNQSSLLKAFINKFTSDDFFIELVQLTLYPADFGTTQSNKTIDYIREFLCDAEKVIKFNKFQFNKVVKNIQLIKSLLNIRESRSNILTYDNVFQHLGVSDLQITKLIQTAIDSSIADTETFRHLKNKILNQIQAYHEINLVSGNMVLYDNLVNSVKSNTVPIFEAVQQYKHVVVNSYNDLSKLQALNKEEQLADYFVLTDKKSAESLANNLYTYVSKDYSFLKTGYKIFDKSSEGFESSSVHIISAPSNHGKSIFLSNLTRTLIENNLNEFKEGEVVLFLTLEDDINKLFRRFASIFGNYKYSSLKRMFKKGYELSKAEQENNPSNSLEVKIRKMFVNVIHTSIMKTTGEKIGLVLKHSNENSFSASDLGRFIDSLKVEGYKVKMVFADYIDVMSPSVTRYNGFDDYNAQGQIVQELRSLSRLYKIPVISASQNKREAENVTSEMSNAHIGDSYKKIRYADYVYMCRMRRDLDLFSSPVKEHVFDINQIKNGIDQTIINIKDELSIKLIPFEIKIIN